MGGPQKCWFSRGFTHIWDLIVIPWVCSIGWDHLSSTSQVHFQRRGHQEAAARGKRQVPRDCVSAALDLDGFGWTWSCLLRMTWSLLHVLFLFFELDVCINLKLRHPHFIGTVLLLDFFPSVYGPGMMHPPVAKDVQWRQIMKDRDLQVASNIH